jgi:hypothetical protein
MEDPFVSVGFTTVTLGEANKADWNAIVITDPMREIEVLPGWVTKLLPGDDGGWNASLVKREC